MIGVSGISKRYGFVQALADVNLDIGEAEVLGLAGENGSGKSTLAKILSGVVEPDAGTIHIDGRSVQIGGPHDAMANGIALVAQEVTVVPSLTVAENVLLSKLPRGLRSFSRSWAAREAAPVLERVGLACDPLTPLSELSISDAVLVEVSKALTSQPRLLILDEATSRLGETGVEQILALVRDLKNDGISSIIITHRLAELTAIADRTVVLRDGVRVGELDARETTDVRLSQMMVGRDLTDFFHKRQIERGEPLLSVRDLVADAASGPVSFDVHAGELVALAGLIGSGRSELLETIAGARTSRGGSVLVDGTPVRAASPRAALAAGIALVPEDRRGQGLVTGASVRTNVALGSWSSGATASARQETAMAHEAVIRLRIKTAGVDAPVDSLSGGNQQKVVLGRCLARSPKVLILDEPTRGIDVGAKEELFELIGQMLADGMAVLLATSEMLETLGLADRVLVMHESRIVAELPRQDATEERIALLAGGGTHDS